MVKKFKKLTKRTEPVWDLDRDGVTATYLAKFFGCPERFRLYAVEGLSSISADEALAFGNAFHACLEARSLAKGKPIKPHAILEKWRATTTDRIFRDSSQTEDAERIIGLVETMFPLYEKRWAAEDKGRKYVLQEQAFDVPHQLPTGRTIRLRGRWDGVYKDAEGLWLQENKTKGRIDEDGLQAGLPNDLQTMLYCLSLAHQFKSEPKGVLYNVIRRPGSTPNKRTKETLKAYLERIGEEVSKSPDYYFMRWYVELSSGDLLRWVERSLNPTLIRLVAWWDSIKSHPFNPWYTDGPNGESVANHLHWQRPFGVRDGFMFSERGDFFDAIAFGDKGGYEVRSVPFPELVE